MSLDRRAGAPLPPALYLECDGGSLSEMCLPDTQADDLVKSLKQFTPEHLFYTTMVGCKFTCWTETGGQNIPMSREMFGEMIKQTKNYCKSQNLPVAKLDDDLRKFKNTFVGTTNDGRGIVMQWHKVTATPQRPQRSDGIGGN
ncbi:hypothetical protein DFH28DRAFT_1104965 [Melampsora americana]|nr:hypothetical protein DFH28DRAFT_1104965 [Melampsora americana]